MASWLTASYVVACGERDVEARAAAIASEQSVECPTRSDYRTTNSH